jgi:phage protein U
MASNQLSWKNKVLIGGALIGAITGIGTAYLLIQRAEKEGEPLSFSSGQGIKLGMAVLAMLRQVLQLGEEASGGEGKQRLNARKGRGERGA